MSTPLEEDIAKRRSVGVSLATHAFHLKERQGTYRDYLTAFEEAKRWDWDPEDDVVRDTFYGIIAELLEDEGIGLGTD